MCQANLIERLDRYVSLRQQLRAAEDGSQEERLALDACVSAWRDITEMLEAINKGDCDGATTR